MKVGDLFRFVCAPTRRKSDEPRRPGKDVEGKTGIITGGPFEDAHDWGGAWTALVGGLEVHHWGDFMEVISESR